MQRAEFSAQLDTASVRQPNVENSNIRTRGRHSVQSFFNAAGFTDHLEIVLAFEHVAHAPTDNFVVVHQKDPQRHP